MPSKIALQIAYEGSAFHGYGIQPQERTIQGCLEKALKTLFKSPIATICAGRTDAGVHALGQWIHFECNNKIPLERLPIALNSLLPGSIRVLQAQKVAPDFSARFSARSRQYRYYIRLEQPNPFETQRVWSYLKPLDTERLKQSWESLPGYRDCSAFCKSGSYRSNMHIDIKLATCQVRDNLIQLDIQADSFLYNMVRSLVGTAVEIGRSRFETTHFETLFSQPERQAIGATAPAQGLYLYRVDYPPEYALKDRALPLFTDH